jgi:TP901 family phage tail tape measure protein
MPMRMGEMMVVVRAQDFASRTLRRVGSELHHMTRAQMVAARQSDIAFDKMRASMRLEEAKMPMANLRVIERRNQLLRQEAQVKKTITDVEQRRARLTPIDPMRRTLMPRGMSQDLLKTNLQLSQLNSERGRLQRGLMSLEGQISRMPATFQRAATSEYEFARSMGASNRRLVEAEHNLNRAQRAELAFNQALSQMPIRRLHEIGAALGGMGRTMQLFGAISTAAFGFAAAGAADFSKGTSLAATQMTRIGAGTAEAVRNVDALDSRILKLSKDFPFSAREMSDAIYEIFSGTNVQSIDQGIHLLEAFARVGVGGQVDLTTATKAGIIVLNNFAGAGENVSDTLNRMFAIVRFGFMRFQDFSLMLPKVAAAAAGSGQSLDDMAGAMAFLTRRTGSASIAATQISRAFDVMTRKEFQEGMKGLGIEITDVEGRLLPLPKILKNIVDGLPSLRTGGRDLERFIQIVTRVGQHRVGGEGRGLVSTTEARRFFRFIFRGFDQYNDLQNKTTKDNTEFRRSFEVMMQSNGVQWDIFVNRVRVAMIIIGQAAIPVFAAIGTKIAELIDWWGRMDASTRGTLVKWGVIISIGTLLGGTLLSITGALLTMGATAFSGITRIAGLAASFMGLTTAMGPAAGLAAGLLGLLLRLGTIGAIVIVLKAIWGGNPTAISFLAAAFAGGMLGARFGPAGAVLGAITLPILLKFITQKEKTPLQVAYEDYKKEVEKGFGGNKTIFETHGAIQNATLSYDLFLHKLKDIHDAYKMVGRNAMKLSRVLSPADMKLWVRYGSTVIRALEMADKGVKKHKNSWENWVKTLKNAFKQSDIEAITKKLTKDTLSDIDKMFDQVDDNAADLASQMNDTARQARITAVDNLRQMYTQMEDVNRRAFGDLFQGPWLTSETFDIAKEWGITPRIQDMIKDLDGQIDQFRDRRVMIDTLFKRGLPQGFLKELQEMTPEEAMPILRELITATPQDTRKLIALLNSRERMIKQATIVDFTHEINEFRKAGLSMGDNMIEGFKSAQVAKWFDNWVQDKFPDVIAAAVKKAVDEFRRQNPPEPKPAGATAKNKGGVATTGVNTSLNNTNDHSRTITIHMPPPPGGRTADAKAEERRRAFVAVNAAKNWLY